MTTLESRTECTYDYKPEKYEIAIKCVENGKVFTSTDRFTTYAKGESAPLLLIRIKR